MIDLNELKNVLLTAKKSNKLVDKLNQLGYETSFNGNHVKAYIMLDKRYMITISTSPKNFYQARTQAYNDFRRVYKEWEQSKIK